MTQRRKQHALAIPMPGPGHMNPMLRFCEKLAFQGGFTCITLLSIEVHHGHEAQAVEHTKAVAAHDHDNDGAVTDAHNESSASVNVHKIEIRRASLPLFLRPPQDDDGGRPMEDFFTPLLGLGPQIETLLLRLQQEAEEDDDAPITCIISELFMTGATQSVADKLGLPRIAFHPASQSMLLLYHHMLQGALSMEEVVKVLSQRELLKEEIFKEGLEGLPTLRVGDLIECMGEDLFFSKFMSHALQESVCKAHAMVVNSFEELEGNALRVKLNLPVYAIGPLVEEPLQDKINTSLWKEDHACMVWLDQQPFTSVLFVSFGSFASLSLPQFDELIAGLVSSEQRFLLVYRPNLVSNVSYTIEELLSKSDGKGYITSWAPQLQVLSHPSVGGFLTHCGWNSTLEALSKGVPMLCFPYYADQFLDAKLIVEEWKVGLHLGENKANKIVKREEIERAIRAFMEGEEGKNVNKNAKYFKEACQRTYLPEGLASRNVQALVQTLN